MSNWRVIATKFDADSNVTYITTKGSKRLDHREEDELKALLAGWRPIETAPRDGTDIDAVTPHGVEVVRWNSWDGSQYAPGDGWIGIEQDSTCLPPNYRRPKAQCQPTLWRPRPLPPAN
ncbi:hypothetical protein [Vreelandella venusta]|uniref:hypothetical protein n=1 Tax=Vreelandella venusta TaxID=44935 RepID=UPI003F66FC6D